jgi:hypothetical protein
MKIALVATSFLALALTGCFPGAVSSPIDPASKIADISLLGVWSATCPDFLDRSPCRAVVKTGEGSTLSIEFALDKQRVANLRGELFKIGTERYLDLSISDLGSLSNVIPTVVLAHIVPVHSMWKVQLSGGTLTLTPLNSESIRRFREDGIHTADPWRDDSMPLITTAPKELKAFLEEHAAEVFTGDSIQWNRSK